MAALPSFGAIGLYLYTGARCNGIAMLVLSRKVGERILIGDDITITVVRLSNGGVRLGIEAPVEIPVVREEVKSESEVRKGTFEPVTHRR